MFHPLSLCFDANTDLFAACAQQPWNSVSDCTCWNVRPLRRPLLRLSNNRAIDRGIQLFERTLTN
jgi:hypothetical protein